MSPFWHSVFMQYLFISHFHSHLKFKRNHVATKESKVLVDRPTFFFFIINVLAKERKVDSEAKLLILIGWRSKTWSSCSKMIPTLYHISRLFQVSENLRKQGKFIAFFLICVSLFFCYLKGFLLQIILNTCMNSAYWILSNCNVKVNWKKTKIRSFQTLTDKSYKKIFWQIKWSTLYYNIYLYFFFILSIWLQKINQHKVDQWF